MKLLQDMVLVLRDPLEDDVSSGGIVKPANYRRPKDMGRVIDFNIDSRGGVFRKPASQLFMRTSVMPYLSDFESSLWRGDHILFDSRVGIDVDPGKLGYLADYPKDYEGRVLLMRETDIMAVLESENESQ